MAAKVMMEQVATPLTTGIALETLPLATLLKDKKSKDEKAIVQILTDRGLIGKKRPIDQGRLWAIAQDAHYISLHVC
ncbi:MAG: hypothetical protein AAFU53_06415 [Cyanobacteria bacterium J06632_3]